MTSRTPPNEHSIHSRMMAALDGELDAAELAILHRELEDNDAYRVEWDQLSRLKEVTDTMSLQSPPGEVWAGYWESVYRRIERGVGWILFSIGAIVLLSYGAWEAIDTLLASNAPLLVKGGLLSTLVGLIILGISVTREKMFTHRRDKYKGVNQ